MQGKDQVTVHFDLFPILLLGVVLCLQWKEKPSLFYILGDVLCLHQIGNHEPVEFGEFGIDPVERDQVLKSILPDIDKAITTFQISEN